MKAQLVALALLLPLAACGGSKAGGPSAASDVQVTFCGPDDGTWGGRKDVAVLAFDNSTAKPAGYAVLVSFTHDGKEVDRGRASVRGVQPAPGHRNVRAAKATTVAYPEGAVECTVKSVTRSGG